MVGPIIREVLLENQGIFLIPVESAASIIYHYSLSRSLSVLSEVDYFKIPILGKDDHSVELVSLLDMVNKVTDLQTVSMDPLEGLAVADVTETDVPTVGENWEPEEVLHLLVNLPFLPAVTEDRIFKGIITRRELLRAINFMMHELERRNILSPKIEEPGEQIDIVN